MYTVCCTSTCLLLPCQDKVVSPLLEHAHVVVGWVHVLQNNRGTCASMLVCAVLYGQLAKACCSVKTLVAWRTVTQ